jgi:hypothetical protein
VHDTREKVEQGTNVLTVFALYPAPPHSVLYAKLDAHVTFMSTAGEILLVFRSNVGARVERFGVHFDKIGHANNPMLWEKKRIKMRKPACTVGTRTCLSELLGRGILGIETEASRRCSMSGLGSSSSSYSKACLRFRSGEERPSSGGGAETGEEYLDSGALGAAEV